MEYKVNKISVEKKGTILLKVNLESELKNHLISEEISLNESHSKKYKLGNGELLVEFDAEEQQLKIKNDKSFGNRIFNLKNITFSYNESFITELLIKIREENIEVTPSFYIFEDSFQEIITESIKSLENLQNKLNKEYKDLTIDSIKQMK